MKDSNQRKSGAILSYISIIVSTLVQILYTPLLIKMMGQSEYGLYSLVSSIIGYLTVLDLGFGNAIIVYTAKYRAQQKYEEEKNIELQQYYDKPIYNKKSYTVKFYDNFGNLIDEQTVPHGENAIEPINVDKEGYTFAGWDKEFTNVVEDLVVTGQYEAIYHTVTFIDMYGDVIEIKSVQSHTEVEAPTAPIVDYHTFDKWNQNLDNITDDLTVQAVYKFNNKIYDIKDVNYWLQILSKKYNINKSLLDTDGINIFNTKVTSDYSKTKVVDLSKISQTETYSNVYSLITKYSNINKYTIYNDSTSSAISSSEKTTILNNRNLENIPTTITVKFGIITNFAWMRSYPTNYYSDKYKIY